MHAFHRSSSRPAPSAGQSPTSSFISGLGALILLGLLSALLAGCGPQATPPAPAAAGEDSERFAFVRARVGFVRVDTTNGQTWTVPVNGDGGWEPRGATPDPAGEPARNGRFQVMHIVQPRNTTRIGDGADPPVLIRVDRATGRTWLLESDDAQSWMAVGESGQSPAAEPAARPMQPAPGPAASSPAVAPGSPDEFPIQTGDLLGVTPEEKAQTVQTLRTARTKAELPQKMRVWAVRQLGQVDPDLAVPELIDALEDPDPAVVAEAVRQLGQIGQASSLPHVLKLRQHPDPGVRAAVSEMVVEVD